MRVKTRALFLPWIVGAISAGIVGAFAASRVSEAQSAANHPAEPNALTESVADVPELVIIPELSIVESGDASEIYPSAP